MIRLNPLLISLLVIFCLIPLVQAQEPTPTPQILLTPLVDAPLDNMTMPSTSVFRAVISDLTTSYAAILLIVIAGFSILTGGGGLILYRISKNPMIMEAAERSYLQTNQSNKMLIDLLGNSLSLAERLARSVVPVNPETGRPYPFVNALGEAVDILEEITDDIPFSDKKDADVALST